MSPRHSIHGWDLFILSLLAVLVFPNPAATQELGGAEYSTRRTKLLSLLPEDGVVILSNAPRRDVDYLTGVDLGRAQLILVPESLREGSPVPEYWKNTLYLPPFDPRWGVWDDPEPHPGPEAMHATGIENTANLSSFIGDLSRVGGITGTVWLSWGDGTPTLAGPSSEEGLAATVQRLLPDVRIRNLAPYLEEMLWSKTALQIEIMREAVDITEEAYREAARLARPGMYEYEIEAAINYVFRARGSTRPAFMIVGSGPNSCVLHHMDNDRLMGEGELLLIDIGTVYRTMATDLTRTIPLDGTFSEEQAEIYSIVLEANKAAISIVRPGITLAEVHQAAQDVIEAAGYGEYFIHGTSHTLNGGAHSLPGTLGTGLSRAGEGEPVDQYGVNNRPLVPGAMFTIEPGIYIPEKELGVRIEDDILVTETGYEVLTKNAPKEIDEIEALMREASGRFRQGSR